MAYCSQCGTKNEDTAKFCKKCGASLSGIKKDYEKEMEKRCEEECVGGGKGFSIFWGIIIILIGLYVIFEFVLKNMGLVSGDFPWWSIFIFAIGVIVVIFGFRIIIKK
jgi:uncharacterized membrane protein YvbJ